MTADQTSASSRSNHTGTLTAPAPSAHHRSSPSRTDAAKISQWPTRSYRNLVAEMLKHLKELLGLYEAEGMVMPMAEKLHMAAYAANRVGDAGKVAEFGERARELWMVLFRAGSGDVTSNTALLQDPESPPTGIRPAGA
ncbi:hypothetical protein PspLS_03016 [Pyricularia sp. CBS 133598]|nr:hypothetical protein PspLS_03016 [Pyricularia sp. CBS 133598]